ncbi:MAG: primosomal protein N' [Gemmatimonadetes bacterium]|uniref:Replication restart protein PriA n=1 Tax=Candidatus Kutchimonas denitrificans TaxID=3056748 RepID=A0AAE4Z5H4_9BACT|nr:primosomal protein N' [Gemmatimonadota bacterium]NIR74165.1 primosomal protein N' [Candidatus Kutchimonas denitrificans]NIS01347.1 primosomal protein N' [Gemmatimonadota bacterium]NIT67078.1 primosomal protein N' [Gemmatimonadota bacterium]NIU51738.1 primosomal protein N' [Gemmatimonadota bacterium]
MSYARVAVPRPLYRTFLYRIPPDLANDGIGPGRRVLVPFGRHRLIGWVDEIAEEPADIPARIRDILDVPDPEPVLDESLLAVCRWVARYYAAPLGLTFRAALPAALSAESADRLALRSEPATPPDNANERALLNYLRERRGPIKLTAARKALGAGPWARAARSLAERGVIEIEHEAPDVEPPQRTRQVVVLTRELPSLQERRRIFGRARRQQELFEYLETVDGRAEVAHLIDQLGMSRSVVRGLADRGVAEIREEETRQDPLAGLPVGEAPPPVPTPAQKVVIRRLIDSLVEGAPTVHVLKGVTGSGKTLVYIELLRELVGRRGRAAILLVPEISLTPQTLARFRGAFGDDVALLHSALSEGERFTAWESLRSGAKRIVIGARSAVFAPVRDLGAIIIDEEHESSYKQHDPAPRYHAREVAAVRAHRDGALCLLGSATPSLESWANVQTGSWRLLQLPERIGARPLPGVSVVDLREERKERAGEEDRPPGPLVLSRALHHALQRRLESGEQSILLLNRRGYSTFVQCRDCGAVQACPHCNVSLTVHRRPARLVCHHCYHQQPVPDACPDCGSVNLSHRGVGTEQVERVLGETFPRARLARMDVDTTSGKWSHHRILDRVGRGAVDVLLGTQMIAKGLDFPNVTLVGVINADVGLSLPDFRASENTFQLLTQVAGRAGRGPAGGEVIIQTALPGHYAVRFALAHDYDGFAARELDERAAPAYPPHIRLANLVLSGTAEARVQEGAEAALRWLIGLFEAHSISDIDAIGPAPCPIDRIRGRWRWHLLLKAHDGEVLGRVLRYMAARFEPPHSGLRIEIDRDPVSLL